MCIYTCSCSCFYVVSRRVSVHVSPMQSQRLLYNRPILDILNCMYSSVDGSATALRRQISKDTNHWIDQLVVWLGIVRVVRACRIILTVILLFPHIGVHKCKGRIWLCSTTLFKNKSFRWWKCIWRSHVQKMAANLSLPQRVKIISNHVVLLFGMECRTTPMQ